MVSMMETTECLGEESSLAPLLQGGCPLHHTTHLSCTNLDLALVTTREGGSTLCDVSVICIGNDGIICSYVDRCRTVLVMSDVRARLTSRVVPPYTSYTGHTVAAAAAW